MKQLLTIWKYLKYKTFFIYISPLPMSEFVRITATPSYPCFVRPLWMSPYIFDDLNQQTEAKQYRERSTKAIFPDMNSKLKRLPTGC